MIKLSVIIPVYNGETYLTKCVDSVLNQNYTGEVEIILVDDGSTDKSLSICNYYATKDNRIKVIHKENGGAGSARNVGIIASSGDYIAFLDADDFWIENTIHELINTTEYTQADIVIGKAIRYMDKEGRFIPYPNISTKRLEKHNPRDMLSDILNPEKRFEWHVWKCVYKAKFIKNNGLFFKNGILYEDIEWMPRVFSLAISIEITDKIFVCNRVKEADLLTDDIFSNIVNHQDMLKVIYSLSIYFKYIGLERDIKELFYANFAEIYVNIFIRQGLIKDKKSKVLLDKLSHYIDFYQGIYSDQLKSMIKFLGYRKTCKIISSLSSSVLHINKIKKEINKRFIKLKENL